MKNRYIQTMLEEYKKNFPIISITGPRQSGKTTLSKIAFASYRYISLETPENRTFAENDPKGFLEKYDSECIFDEIQNVPLLFSYLQEKVDSKNQPAQFVITGSQNFLLSEHINQSLSGRVGMLTLLPFQYAEIADICQHKTIDTVLFEGMYPRIQAEGKDAKWWYQSYIQTYIERDVRMIKNIGNLSLFQKFLKLCAGRVGQILNYSSLANDIGVSYHTVQSWISLLESSYLIFLASPYYNNFSKRVIKSPKLYFYDTGILCSLLNISDVQQLENHYLRGGIFENFVFLERKKTIFNTMSQKDIFFFRDQQGFEIDLLEESGTDLIAAEIKSSQTIHSDFFKNLKKWKSIPKNINGTEYLWYAGTENRMQEGVKVCGWREIGNGCH